MSGPASRIAHAFDPVAMAHVLARLAGPAQTPWLHTEVAQRMAQRLDVIRLQPERVMAWWPGWGGGAEQLAQVYPRAQCTWVEPSDAWLAHAQARQPAWWRPSHWARPAPTLVREDALPDGTEVQLLWANMMLHAVADPPALLARWHRWLAVDGFVMFSCLGPGTLAELRAVYAAQGWPPAHADFVDMHDLGDMLVHAGFADPVMDQETLTLTWADPQALLAELRQLGGNVSAHRFPGLRTPRWQRRLASALQMLANAQGRLPLTFEVVYGHAFKAPPRVAVRSESTVSLEAMRGMVRRARTTDGA
jgi:malonyl-CoA O-methyltransferase